jgi:hypothetical protein
MPIVSIGWGIWDGEPFLLVFTLWISIILAGVYMANRPANKMTRFYRLVRGWKI